GQHASGPGGRHADAHRNFDRTAFEDDRLAGDRHADTLTEKLRLLEVHRAPEDRKLLPSITCKEVLAPRHLRYERGERTEHVIACEMAKGVVDPLEVIEIEEHERELRRVPRYV